MVSDGVEIPESTIVHREIGECCMASPGSESTACRKSKRVNVGDPVHAVRVTVLVNKCKSEDTKKVDGKSEGSSY